MYRAYFGIEEHPFTITPNPRFLYLSQGHRDALAHLHYGMGRGGGFVLLTGEVGTGKTTLCRTLLDQSPAEVDTALILNPKQTAVELVASICDELHVSYPPETDSLKVLVGALNHHLLEAHSKGRLTVLLVDEAQNLGAEVLEQIRLLTNLETETQKLLQILLVGQPELQTLLARPELRQLDQRITARYHLMPLSAEETTSYIQHRLEVVGLRKQLFTRPALRLVHRLSGGVPRLINVICDRSLLGAYGEQRERVSRGIVRNAASEVMRPPDRRRYWRLARWASAAVLMLVVLGVGWRLVPEPTADPEIATLANTVDPEPEIVTEAHTVEMPPVVVVTPKPVVVLNDLLADPAVDTRIETAFATLFGYWDLAYQDLPGGQPCERAISAGLRCVRGSGNWGKLRYYNRPAVVELIDRAGRRHQAAVAALEPAELTLDFGEQRVTLPLSEVERFWRGDYVFLWKPPELSSSVIGSGNTGADVLWLRAQLDRAEGVGPGAQATPRDPRFDAELGARIRGFQRAHGLTVDGIVGEQTLLHLDRVAARPGAPVLGRSASDAEG